MSMSYPAPPSFLSHSASQYCRPPSLSATASPTAGVARIEPLARRVTCKTPRSTAGSGRGGRVRGEAGLWGATSQKLGVSQRTSPASRTSVLAGRQGMPTPPAFWACPNPVAAPAPATQPFFYLFCFRHGAGQENNVRSCHSLEQSRIQLTT